MQYIYLMEALCPGSRMSSAKGQKLASRIVPELLAKRQTRSLRQLAREYGVSHETVRVTLARSQRKGWTVSLV